MHALITKWIEPYVLLETLKKQCELKKVYTFDGFSKNSIKKEFLKMIEDKKSFGLYMKNVNNFYLFEGEVDFVKLFALNSEDYELTSELDKPFDMVDLGKAEAGFIMY